MFKYLVVGMMLRSPTLAEAQDAVCRPLSFAQAQRREAGPGGMVLRWSVLTSPRHRL